MSFAGSALTAKLVLTADAKSVVGAGAEARLALKSVADQARDTGKAGAEMAAGLAVGTEAMTVQTREQAAMSRGLSLVGDGRKAELALLTQQAKQSGVVTSGIAAMSVAHNTYNASVTEAKSLLDAGLISQTKYKTAVDAAGVALALAATETAGMGATTAKAQGDVAALENLLTRLGVTAGVGGGQIKNLRGALKALPEVVANYPVASAFIGITAAIGIAVAANQYYDSSVRQVTITDVAHGNALGLQRMQYLALANQISDTASVSQVAGRNIAASLIGGGINPAAWLDATSAAAGYARVIGEDVPKAQSELNNAIVSQSGFDQLNAQYGLVSDSQAQLIRHLDEAGDHFGAQAERAKALKDRFGELKDQVGLVSGAFEGAETAVSNFFSNLGERFEKGAPWILALPALAGGTNAFSAALAGAKNAGTPKDQPLLPNSPMSGSSALRNQQSLAVGDILRRNNPFPSQLADNAADRDNILKAQKDGAIDAATATAALNSVDTKNAEILKAQHDAYLNLNETLKQHEDRIKQLVASGPQVLAQAKAEADAAQAQADVAGKSTLEQQKLTDAFNIQKTTLPYTTALLWAHGTAAQKLKDIIAGLTDEMTRNQQASHYADTVNDIQGQLSSIGSGTGASVGAINLQLSENVRKLDDWKKTSLANLDATQAGYQDFVTKVGEIYDTQLAQIYEDDLARRKDWASGTELALLDMKRSQEDWATTSRNLTQGAGQEFENDFVDAVINQKDPLSAFFNWYIEQLVRVAYQQKLAGSFNQVAGGLTDLVGQAFGLGGGAGKIGVVSASEDVSGLDFSNLLPGGRDSAIQLHGGGSVRGGSVTRGVDYSAIASLPRFHGGTKPGLNVGETLAVLRDDEYVDTAEQRRARNNAVTQPQVYMLPGSNGGGAAPIVNVNVVNNSGTALGAQQGPTTQNADGSFNIDVLVDKFDAALAQKNATGNSQYTASLEQSHNLSRQPQG